MNNKNIYLKAIYNNSGKLLFLLFIIILFRDFLYTYRIQLEKFLPYYEYQGHIIYLLTGDKSFDLEAPMNLRFLGLYIQFFIFKYFPCLELNHLVLGDFAYDNYVCATFSNALMNYLSLCAILSLSFVYALRKLKLNLPECLLTILLFYIYLNHVEAFTLDRISILFLLIILYFLDNKKFTIFLILFSAIVNEKIIFILGGIFFIRYVLIKDKNFRSYFFFTLVSAFFAILIFYYYAIVLDNGYLESDVENGLYDTYFTYGLLRVYSMFTSKSGLSNGAIPLLLAILPYVLTLFIKVENKFQSKFDFLVPISMIAFTAGGGMEQTGRYVMYTMPIWIPLFAQQIIFVIKKIETKNVQK